MLLIPQWFVAEQIEEEAQAKNILDKIHLIGDDKGGLYLFDRDIQQPNVKGSNNKHCLEPIKPRSFIPVLILKIE
jgi:hypothetical protein